MAQWWTYRPEDFLMFSPRVFWRLYELHNEGLWPLPVATLLLGCAAFWGVASRRAGATRLVLAGLSLGWAFVGWSFLWNRYAAINWAVAYAVPLFALQALLLASRAARRLPATRRARARPARFAGVLLAGAALAYPLLAPLAGRPLVGGEVFGVAPDPTAIGTLGLLLLAGEAGWLLPVPILWCLFSAITLWTLGEPQGWLAFAAVPIAVAGWRGAGSTRARRSLEDPHDLADARPDRFE